LKRKKRIAVLLAFGLIATLFVATSAPAAAVTDSQNLYVHCGFTPGWGLQNSGSAFTSDVSISAPDSVNAGDTFQVLVDLNEQFNGPVGVGTGVLDFSADINVSGAVAGGAATVPTASFINGPAIPANTAFDISPGSTDEDSPGTYDGLVVDVTADAVGGVLTLELDIGKIRPGPNPGGAALDCSYSDNADASLGTYIHPTINVNVIPPFAGSFAVDSVNELIPGSGTGQTVTTHARQGANQILLDGSGFNGSTAITLGICDVAAPIGDPSCISAGGGFTDPTGAFDDAVLVVAGGETTGARDIVVSDGTYETRTGITILGTRTLIANPGSGGGGTNVALTGSNWDPNEAVSVVGMDTFPFGTPTDFAGAAAVDANGNLTGSLLVNNPATASIGATAPEHNPAFGPPPIIAAASAPYAFAAESCSAGSDGTGSCDLFQNIILDILPGELTQTRGGVNDNGTPGNPADDFLEDVDLGDYTLNGQDQAVTGDIYTVTVVDARGNSLGWTLNAELTDFNNTTPAGVGDNTIENTSVTLTPACADASGGSSGLATAGGASTMGGAITLCSSAAGVGGGTWDVDAQIDFTYPASQNAGAYLAVLKTTLS